MLEHMLMATEVGRQAAEAMAVAWRAGDGRPPVRLSDPTGEAAHRPVRVATR
jgi:hypothetical protein